MYPGKNLGALGEAGAVVTNDAALADEIRTFRDHGSKVKYYHTRIGWNGRMDGIQGAALRIKLRTLAQGNAHRRAHAARYAELLRNTEAVLLPTTAADRVHVFHLYVVRVAERDRVLQELSKRGIGCGIHYPKPVHLQDAYAFLGVGRGSLPVTERMANEILSLPMFPELTPAQIECVARELKAVIVPQTQRVVAAGR
jgi:dTDP-4-amino-4,6-dideoxygalactose transaminase